MARHLLALAAAGVLLTALAACSSGAPPVSGTPAVAPAGQARDQAQACTALLGLDAAIVAYPGGDPEAPPPSADVLRQWTGMIAGPLDTFVRTAPAELDSSVATIGAAVTGIRQGAPVNTEDPALLHAKAEIDRWGHDNCGFTPLDVVGTGFESLPKSLPAGPLAVSFRNEGPPESAGFVLFVFRVKDGTRYTIDELRAGTTDPFAIADLVAAIQPTEQDPTGYGSLTLTPGRYVVASPLGRPPSSTGFTITDFEVR